MPRGRSGSVSVASTSRARSVTIAVDTIRSSKDIQGRTSGNAMEILQLLAAQEKEKWMKEEEDKKKKLEEAKTKEVEVKKEEEVEKEEPKKEEVKKEPEVKKDEGAEKCIEAPLTPESLKVENEWNFHYGIHLRSILKY